ncbi:hypothetical protein [Piscibacillus halophilus]|uniref:DUF4829 domain-containing protein n=1 Tax=Piscibacillus halophilus TaxID=571933 RepID=A0A1H9E5Y8_9BACI|nr:hypothetical protein [Piscibacillus halophilus]SEQ21150.1 hypothetical protein SAMN05216362_10875 [Piscibacillus halophilus]
MRKGNGKAIMVLVLFVGIIILLFISFLSFTKSSEEQAAEAVHQFYKLEQKGTFSESWEMFHPQMQQKFEKSHYLQDRPHVFMNHFGVDTYTYTISDPTEVQDWSMESGVEPIDRAFLFKVYKTYKGKYGNFTIVQDVYTAEVQGEWSILWDYNK